MDVRSALPELVMLEDERGEYLRQWVMQWTDPESDPTGLRYRGEVDPEPEPLVKGTLQPASKKE